MRVHFGTKFSMNERGFGEKQFADVLKQRNHHMAYNFEYRKKENQTQIARDNTTLLKRLVQIHIGKGNGGGISNLDSIQKANTLKVHTNRGTKTRNLSPLAAAGPSIHKALRSGSPKRGQSSRATISPRKVHSSLAKKEEPKTIHAYTRKQEQDRIVKENLKLVKKIFGIEPAYSTSKCIDEYHQNMYYKENLQRIKRR